jgi:phosphopantothenoylcysteine decarboxylase/phosphopantothenate--cysteine ligase
MWKGKRILVGITGGIAAYKTPLLVRELIKLGAEVKCIMTPASFGFVTPLTLATLSKNEVYSELYNSKSGVWTNHVDLALWADLFIIAPLTATSLAKMAVGHSDNLLLTTYLSSKCPVFVAPAMDLDMYTHPATKANFQQLEKNGVVIIPSQSGELASGLVGEGRMEEPTEIIRFIESYSFEKDNFFQGKKVLITAGPTYESIDPVRFIGNHSSGKMGVELAYSFAQKGAKVHLILGPSILSVKHKNIEVNSVETANEMLAAVQSCWKQCDIGVFAAAVADYRPKDVAKVKIKKLDQEMTLILEKNPDIISWAGENKTNKQCLVGFALETNDEEVNAQAKLHKKKLDFIVLNSLANKGAGFRLDTNQVSIMDKDNKFTNFELLSKRETAQQIVHYLRNKLNENN